MMQHFRSSPLWLIGLFIIFAQATAGIAAINVTGWPQDALVIFVISYSTLVTAVFFAFLWFKPNNFYGPSEYGAVSPAAFADALRGRMPDDTAKAVAKVERNPRDDDAIFALMDNLLSEIQKQHLILMRKFGDSLDVSRPDQHGHTHSYEIITRDRAISVGVFSPRDFVRQLSGTELIRLTGDRDRILLTAKGKEFADWLIEHERDARTFNSEVGSWGEKQSAKDALQDRFNKSHHRSHQASEELGDESLRE